MAYYVKKNGQLEKIAGNVSISLADWNETDDRKFTKIKNKPDTLNTLDEIMSNENEHSLAGANALKELTTTVAGMGSELIKTSAKVNLLANSDLGINVVEKGENIHLDDSSDNKLVEFGLYGKAVQNKTTGKNLLPYPYDETTHTESGVTWTDNNGIVTTKGTATAMNDFLFISSSTPKLLKKGTYILSGCPSGGQLDKTYFLLLGKVVDGQASRIVSDTGSGATFTLEEDTTICLVARFISGTNADGLIFKPMIRLASVTDATYEPYTGGQPSPRPDCPQDIVVAGESYNLLNNTASTQTVNGITFTVNEDKSVTANGTATDGHGRMYIVEKMPIAIGKYHLSGCPKGGSNITYYLRINIFKPDGSQIKYDTDFGNGVIFDITEEATVSVLYNFDKGNIASNHICYPMLRKASVKNDRYMPYGKGSVEVKSCGKNILDFSNGKRTGSGITYTYNADGSVTANGTASGHNSYYKSVKLPKGKYILSGSPGDGSYTKYFISTCTGLYDYGKGVTITLESETTFNVYLGVRDGYVANNLTFYPMIRLATDTDDTYEPYKETLPTIPTPNGLAGIPVNSGGNYTDSNGQQWICDEIIKYADGSGEYIKRIEKLDLSSVNEWKRNTGWVNKNAFKGDDVFSNAMKVNGYVSKANLICNRFIVDTPDNIARGSFAISQGEEYDMFLAVEGITTNSELISYFKNNKTIVYYQLKNEITSPLTPEQLAEIEKLSTFYPATNISNDFDCGMKVKYIADNKAYVDKNLELQMKAQEQTMMSMFLLLPDEMQAAMIENDTNNLLKESGV